MPRYMTYMKTGKGILSKCDDRYYEDVVLAGSEAENAPQGTEYSTILYLYGTIACSLLW